MFIYYWKTLGNLLQWYWWQIKWDKSSSLASSNLLFRISSIFWVYLETLAPREIQNSKTGFKKLFLPWKRKSIIGNRKNLWHSILSRTSVNRRSNMFVLRIFWNSLFQNLPKMKMKISTILSTDWHLKILCTETNKLTFGGFFADLLVADILSIAPPSRTRVVAKLSLNHLGRGGWDHSSVEAATGRFAMAVSNFQIFCAVLVVAVATFINLPAPRFSQKLQEWRNMGQYFNYRGNAIFYQGKSLCMNIIKLMAGICIYLCVFKLWIRNLTIIKID